MAEVVENFPDGREQGKSEGYGNCDRPSNFIQIWFKSLIFLACVTLKFDGWPPETLNSGQNWQIFVPCDPEV